MGKTTLAQALAPKKHCYLNWDVSEDREFILKEQFPAENFIIYDEVHKFKQWRNYVKGLYDKQGKKKKILVTGSARLDYYRYSGDSLQGRYHYYRLHPFSVRELDIKTDGDMKDLLTLGGFPEPFLSGSQKESLRWRKEYRSRVVDEEVSSLEFSRYLSQMELLLLRLPELVGSPLSINSLQSDLSLSHKTVAKYLDILERMYLIYRIPPLASSKLRAVKKEQKCYLYNWAEVEDEALRFENLIGGHLLKWVHLLEDRDGERVELRYFRDTEKREVDFVILKKRRPVLAVECKLQSREISPSLRYFKKKFPSVECVQVHLQGKKEYISKDGIKSSNWRGFLQNMV